MLGITPDSLELQLPEKLTLGVFERYIDEHFRESCEAPKLTFDLSGVSWIGYLPGALFLSWLAYLSKRKKTGELSIVLGPRETLSPVARKLLLDYRLLERCRDLGVEVPYFSSPPPYRAVPLRFLPSAVTGENPSPIRLQDHVPLEQLPFGLARDSLEIVLQELAENSLVHGDAMSPYFGVAFAGGSGPTRGGLMVDVAQGGEYTEIVFGDLGPGIVHRLKRAPKGYLPPYASISNLTVAERTLAYAFEFSSTSDEPARLSRLKLLIDSPQIDPSEIASGLFCVLEVVRFSRGQLIVRTPSAILSYDFSTGQSIARVKGSAAELGLRKVAPLPGTHYLLRLPLASNTSSRASPRTVITSPRATRGPIHLLEAFPDSLQGWGERLHTSLTLVDSHLRSTRQSPGLTLLALPSEVLPTRVAALFVAALRSMSHGARTLMLLSGGPNISIEKSALSQPSSSRRLPFGGPTILFGNPLSTVLDEVPGESLPQSNAGLSSETWQAIRSRYFLHLEERLSRMLLSEQIRKAPGPFLIEGQYYTSVFYQISELTRFPALLRCLAEWCLYHIPDDTPIVVAASRSVVPIVNEIRAVQTEAGRPIATPLVYDRSVGRPGQIAATISLTGQRAVVITDVICRGIQIKRLTADLGSLRIEQVLTLVDARPDIDQGTALSVGFEAEAHLAPVRSVLKETIIPSQNFPALLARSGAFGTEERVFVIDDATNAPTLYVRSAAPRLHLESLLKGPIRESGCLVAGHVEYNDKHYSVFLDLRRLFASLQRELERWILEQMDYVTAQSLRSNWQVYVYDVEGSLAWSTTFFSNLSSRISVRILKEEDLQAPAPPSDQLSDRNVMVLIPTAESGETARRCIELASRSRPKSILLLCVLSRMNALNQAFLASISGYRKTDVHAAFFMELPISAYGASEDLCPVCREVAQLRSLLASASTVGVRNLQEALEKMIGRRRVVPLHAGHSEESRAPSIKALARVRLYALYSAAEFDIATRRALNHMLDGNEEQIDRFLELLSSERLSASFSSETLRSRLYKCLPRIYDRLEAILLRSRPPFPIGRFIGSLIHIAPRLFVLHASALLERFSSSRQEIEEIAIGILAVGIEPPRIGDLFALYRQQEREREAIIVNEVISLLGDTGRRESEAFATSIAAAARLWARLQRSGQFGNHIDYILRDGRGGSVPLEQIGEHINEVMAAWRNDVSRLVTIVEASPVWRRLLARKAVLGSGVAKLDNGMSKLAMVEQMVKSGDWDGNDEALVFQTAQEIKAAADEISDSLYGLFVNPMRCTVWQIGDELRAFDGSVLSVHKKEDQDSPLIFCDLRELNFAVGQVVENWRKHKVADKGGSEVWISLGVIGERVVLELGDNIVGDFRMESEGGLRVVREFCESYGARLDVQVSAGDDRKSLRMAFVPVGLR